MYFTLVVLALLLPASVAFMHMEGTSSSTTRLEMAGAPEGGIVFIADPHLRTSNINHTRQVIEQINDLHPSVVLIGGDFTYGDGDDLSLQEVWSGLDAPVYAVLGNHDYKSGINTMSNLGKNLEEHQLNLTPGDYNVSFFRDGSADYAYADRVAAVLAGSGVRVLRNEHAVITVNGTRVKIVGVDDGWAGKAHPPEVPADGAFVIYMIHEPGFRTNWDANLILAGHTHGGQFIPSGTERIVSGGRVTLNGKITEGNTTTYISRGIGTSNFNTELRFFQTPEIVYITPPGHKSAEESALDG